MLWLWITISCLMIIIFILLLKLYLLQKSAREIETAFNEKLITDSNTLIDISSKDKYMRHLANSINTQLRTLRKERHYFQQGNLELKNAVTNISHDLRTPLTAICGYLDLLEQTENSETAEQYIAVIKERTGLLTQLTEELFRYSLVMSVHQYEEKEVVSLNQALEECIAAYYGAFKDKGITPDIRIPERKIERLLNKAALSRVLENIIGNALKYSDGDLRIILMEDGKAVFCNHAAEMNEVLAEKLFDRYYTVESGKNATGLGLSIARLLTEEMGGRMGAAFEHGELKIWVAFRSPV